MRRLYAHICPVCEKPFYGRLDRATCSDKCRQRQHRQVKKKESELNASTAATIQQHTETASNAIAALAALGSQLPASDAYFATIGALQSLSEQAEELAHALVVGSPAEEE